MGIACWGWNIYEVGELSIMIVSRRSRPTCDKSFEMLEYEIQVDKGILTLT